MVDLAWFGFGVFLLALAPFVRVSFSPQNLSGDPKRGWSSQEPPHLHLAAHHLPPSSRHPALSEEVLATQQQSSAGWFTENVTSRISRPQPANLQRAQLHGLRTAGQGISSPIITSVPLAPLHTPWGDCLEQWQPPTRSHLLNDWALLLGAASCPCHSPDLPCPHWMGLTTRPSWDMGTCCVLARGMVGDAA